MTVGVLHILQDLTAKGTLAKWFQAVLQVVEICIIAKSGKTGTIAFEITKGKVVDDADKAVQLKQ